MSIDRVVKAIKKLYATRRILFFVYVAAATLLLAYIAIVSIQLFYSPDKAVYGARIGTEAVQGQDKQQLVTVAKELYQKTAFRVVADNNEIVSIPASQLDGSFNADAVADDVLSYTVLERLLPLSLWLKRPAVEDVTVQASAEKARTILIEQFGESGEVAPANAALVVDTEGKVSITPEKQGARIDSAIISDLFKPTAVPLGGQVDLKTKDAELVAPEIRSSDLTAMQTRVQALIDRTIVLTVGDERTAVDSKEFGQWLAFTYEGKTVSIGLNDEKVATSLNTLVGPKVSVAAGKSTVALLDGNEVSRVDGPTGRAVDTVAVANEIRKKIDTEGTAPPAIPVTTRDVPPAVTYTREYTKTQAGLQAYLRHLGADHDIRVSVQQLGGSGWSAGARQTEQSISASTYKIYVAVYLLRQIAEGKASFNDTINGVSTRTCLDKMIINSDNACAEAFLARFEAKKVSEFFWSNGYSRGTSMFFSDSLARTTTADLNKIMIEIEQGVIVNGENRAILLDLMGRQVYRNGVPAGTTAAVKDKIGFLNGYLNDAAIVSHPRGTYVISVITKGESWGKIAEITRQVESILYS